MTAPNIMFASVVSFQYHTKDSSNDNTTAVEAMGMDILKKIFAFPAPSSSAASSKEVG